MNSVIEIIKTLNRCNASFLQNEFDNIRALYDKCVLNECENSFVYVYKKKKLKFPVVENTYPLVGTPIYLFSTANIHKYS